MLGRHKSVRWLLLWAVTAFSVSTVVLGFQHARLNANIKDARDKLDYMESLLEGEAKPRSARSLADDDNEVGGKSRGKKWDYARTTLRSAKFDVFSNSLTMILKNFKF